MNDETESDELPLFTEMSDKEKEFTIYDTYLGAFCVASTGGVLEEEFFEVDEAELAVARALGANAGAVESSVRSQSDVVLLVREKLTMEASRR